MPHNKTVGNLALAGYEDIFKASTRNISSECIVMIPLTELHPPEYHPFQVNDDEFMNRLAEGVKEYGVGLSSITQCDIE